MIPMSFAQRRMWFQWRVEGPSASYNSPTVVRLRGELDRTALGTALRDVIGRHEVLRTVFPESDGEPGQRILDLDDLPWEPTLVHVRPADEPDGSGQRLVSLDDLPWDRPALDLPVIERTAEPPAAEVTTTELAGAVARAAAYAFDLATEIPVRVWLFAIAPDEHVLLLVIHHIATDGWSHGPLARDLATAYAARREQRAPNWEPLPVQYADYALWQRELLGAADDPGSVLARQTAYWRAALTSVPEELPLPTDRSRPAALSHRGHATGVGISAGTHRALTDLARGRRATLPMVCQAALAVTLSRLGAGTDIPVGVPVAGRSDEALDDLIGFFVNTLVIRADLTGEPTFTDVLDRVRRTAVDALAHQDVPFDRLVEELAPTRSLARHPLVQVLVAPMDTASTVELPGLRSEVLTLGRPHAKFDLEVSVGETYDDQGAPAGLRMAVMASADLFDLSTVERIAGCLRHVLEAVATDPDVRAAAIDVVQPADLHSMLETWNGAHVSVSDTTVPDAFAAQAARTPRATALICDESELDYRELDQRANALAHRLTASGVGPESTVAVAMERSADLVVALLAVLKTGGAYLPLDMTWPTARTTAVVRDAGARVLLTHRATAGHETVRAAEADGVHLVAVDAASLPSEPHRPVATPLPAGAAYVMYTSGSTGVPKGVVTSHRDVVRLA
ncbi:condensation domain-containing protein, partial [Streptomyces canus]|uniref:condensation domain-containing protein n=1 Tax=Streptomyces canus TaxID=58343 RepID=UPI00340D17BF